MSSPQKIGRWKRFEIAFNKGIRSEAEACQKDWREQRGKMRGLRKIEEAPSEKKTSVEAAPPEKRSSTVVRRLWKETRRSKIDAEAKKLADAALKSKKTEKSAAKTENFPFGKPRPRTFRSSAAPRRFDRLRRDQEEDGQN